MSKEDKHMGIPPVSAQRRLQDEPDPEPYRPKRKNTKEWCKGKVGRPHVGEIRFNPIWGSATCGPSWGSRWFCHHAEICKNCGKRLRWSVGKGECPDLKGGVPSA